MFFGLQYLLKRYFVGQVADEKNYIEQESFSGGISEAITKFSIMKAGSISSTITRECYHLKSRRCRREFGYFGG